jgi:RNase P subunit RPR2
VSRAAKRLVPSPDNPCLHENTSINNVTRSVFCKDCGERLKTEHRNVASRVKQLPDLARFVCKTCGTKTERSADDLGTCPVCDRKPIPDTLQGLDLDPWRGRTGGTTPDSQ